MKTLNVNQFAQFSSTHHGVDAIRNLQCCANTSSCNKMHNAYRYHRLHSMERTYYVITDDAQWIIPDYA